MKTELKTDKELFDWVKENLHVAAVCDILDDMGYRNQGMHQRLRPLDPDKCTFIGRARTIRWMEAEYLVEENPYGASIEAMDSLLPGDVVVHSTDHSGQNAPWGELMSTVAKLRGSVGCVCDSQVRDCKMILEMGYPVFYAGIRPLDSKGRAIVMDYDVPIQSGGVMVQPGDIVFADFDGVVVIPQDIYQEVLQNAIDKIDREDKSRQELINGSTLRQVYDKYQAL